MLFISDAPTFLQPKMSFKLFWSDILVALLRWFFVGM